MEGLMASPPLFREGSNGGIPGCSLSGAAGAARERREFRRPTESNRGLSTAARRHVSPLNGNALGDPVQKLR